MSQIKVVVEQRSRRRWAAFGFLLIVSLTVIAWFIAPSVIKWLRTVNRAFSGSVGTIPAIQLQIAFTAIVFVILALIVGLVVTVASPKRPLNVKEKDLIKEREAMMQYERKARKRQRRLNQEMREYVEKNQK